MKVLMILLMILLSLFSGCEIDTLPESPESPIDECSYTDNNVTIEGCYVVDEYLERMYDEQDENRLYECLDLCRDIRDMSEPDTDEQYEIVLEINNQCRNHCYTTYR